MVTMVLAVLLVIFTLIKVLNDPDVTVWAWIGLALSVGVAVGAALNLRPAHELSPANAGTHPAA